MSDIIIIITEQEFNRGPTDLAVIADVLAELLDRDDTLELAEAVVEALRYTALRYPSEN